MVNLVKTTLTFKQKDEALRFHLLAINEEEGLRLSKNDINVAVEIYNTGYSKDFLSRCIEKGFFKSEMSVRNSITKLIKKGIIRKEKKTRIVESKYLPQPKESDFIFNYQVLYDIKRK